MKQLEKSKLCHYCLSCNRLELETFNGIMRCKEFMPGIKNWRELLGKELQKNANK